ncbi:sulfotransferase domain-containing protein [Neptuniibacter sp. PT34_22]|uniref:sulfotransferase domain-containing protein n=1 Tax=Neptuniibacter sp. PT34_22 TaxID=3398205 RepID=UPI0039F59214
MEKNFILGVGCQKGGTTWLSAQLNKSQNVDLGFTKEYHIFDALYVPEARHMLSRKLKELEYVKKHPEVLAKNPLFMTHLNFYLDTKNYYDYFDSLWQKGEGIVTSVGDITPSYAALPKNALKVIKSELEARGFNVKIVFLMRDPVERCWSMARMKLKQFKSAKPKDIPIPTQQEMLASIYQTKKCEIRTRYESTIKNLEYVFDEQDIFYSFYEKLFEKETLVELQGFLGLNDFLPDTSQKVNVSEKSELDLDVELASDIFNFYRETYEFCEYRFGVKDFWGGMEICLTSMFPSNDVEFIGFYEYRDMFYSSHST